MNIGSITSKGIKYEFKDTDAREKAADNSTKIDEAKITLEDLTATENKTYTADEKKGYKNVTVNVPPTGVSTLYYWENTSYGTYCYTASQTPKVGDHIMIGNRSECYIPDATIKSVTETSFVIEIDGSEETYEQTSGSSTDTVDLTTLEA